MEKNNLEKIKSIGFWFLLIFIPFIGIPLMWIKRTDYSKKKKIIITILETILVIYSLAVYEEPKNNNETSQYQEDIKEETQVTEDESFDNEQTEEKNTEENKEKQYMMEKELTSIGYTEEQSNQIEMILNTVGINEIKVENSSGSGTAISDLYSVNCYANGNEDNGNTFYFTTENGTLFYIGYSGHGLYDSSKGGVLINYNDVNITNKEDEKIQDLITEELIELLNLVSDAKIKSNTWIISRNGNTYSFKGVISYTNIVGKKYEYDFEGIYQQNENEYNLIELYSGNKKLK